MKNMIMMIAISFGVMSIANAGMPGKCSLKEKRACAKQCGGIRQIETCATAGSVGDGSSVCKCKTETGTR